jgi:hypothetical protein
MKEYIFLVGFPPEMQANYEKIIEKNEFCLLSSYLRLSARFDNRESGTFKESCLLLLSLFSSRSEVGVSSAKRKRIDSIVVKNFDL